MKFRIPKISLSLAVALPLSYGTVRAVETNSFAETVRYCCDLPEHLENAVANLRELPERMDPTCSECN
jgi:hypothetical protein